LSLVKELYYHSGLEALTIVLDDHYDFITTLPYQPARANSILFKRVPESFNCTDLRSFYDAVRGMLGYESSIVFLTAAPVDDYLYKVDGEGRTAIIATVGLEPPVCYEHQDPGGRLVGTINVAVVTDYRLSSNAFADLLRVTVEAKSAALSELLLRCSSRSPGTVTDAVAIGGRLAESGGLIFAGVATRVGGWVFNNLYGGLVELGLRRLGSEGLLRNVVGLSLDDLVELAVKLYERAPVPGVDLGYVRVKIRGILQSTLRDPNVWSMLVAARELDLHATSGSIPGLSPEDHLRDSKAIVADELLAFALSMYINGFKGLLATYWVERLKEGGSLDLRLPQFEDDVVSALLGSTLSILYDKLLGDGG